MYHIRCHPHACIRIATPGWPGIWRVCAVTRIRDQVSVCRGMCGHARKHTQRSERKTGAGSSVTPCVSVSLSDPPHIELPRGPHSPLSGLPPPWRRPSPTRFTSVSWPCPRCVRVCACGGPLSRAQAPAREHSRRCCSFSLPPFRACVPHRAPASRQNTCGLVRDLPPCVCVMRFNLCWAVMCVSVSPCSSRLAFPPPLPRSLSALCAS